MQELRPGLFHWKAPHPTWTAEQGGGDVSSYGCRVGNTLLLIDPISTPDLERLAAEHEGAIVVLLTGYWHQRSASELHERFDASVYAPAADGRPDAPSEQFEVGDALPGGVQAMTGFYPSSAALWVPEYRALALGDILVGDGAGGVQILEGWMPEGETVESAAAALRPLLELPVELLLPTHGEPVTERADEALRRALSP